MKQVFVVLLLLLSGAAGSVAANPAYTQGVVNLRAGPSSQYPLVTALPPDSRLEVFGCLDDYSWCDVDFEGNRGWVYGNYLYYDYQDRRVPVLEVGAALGIGILAFSIGDYWGRYYVHRPWYGRRDYWYHRPPPPRIPPPRPGRPGWSGGRPGFDHGGHRPPVGPGPGGRPGVGPAPHPGGRPGPGAGGRPGVGGRPGAGGRPGGGGGPGAGPRPGGGRPGGGGPGPGGGSRPAPNRQHGAQPRPGPQNR